MVQIKDILLLCIAGSLVSAVPTLERRDRDLRCTFTDKHPAITFSEDFAKSVAKRAPSGINPIWGEGGHTTKSGYPHEFKNIGNGIKWANAACNSNKVRTYEFPLCKDKKGNALCNEKKDKEYQYKEKKTNPGPCRVVYSFTDGHFCGIMCHEKGDTNGGGFTRCT